MKLVLPPLTLNKALGFRELQSSKSSEQCLLRRWTFKAESFTALPHSLQMQTPPSLETTLVAREETSKRVGLPDRNLTTREATTLQRS
jgi:hypothetical protein